MGKTQSGGDERLSSPAYDPNNLSPEDEEDRKHDDRSDGIDWDHIIATTEDDFLAGRFAFKSDDYATDQEAMAALEAWIFSIAEKLDREIERTHLLDAASGQGY